MQLDTAEDLVHALRASGLFTPEQLLVVVRDLSPFGADLQAGMRHLVARDRVTLYQLGKIVRGKATDLLVGPYIVLDKLGEGGMGKVFRARHAHLDRTVALKVMRPHLMTRPTVRGRYDREVQAIGRLDHPNIVRVETAGEADGKYYLAMEFVDGPDLARMMRDYRELEVAEACEYARQAALGLQHAHESGLIHRDVKPSNIVVAGARHQPRATEPAVVKLLDLGLARAIDPDDMVSPDLTRDHTVVGTPDYMAPEQAKNSKSVGPPADLYGLGCTLYFLLTGRVPFPVGGALEKLVQHQLDQPDPLQSLRPGVPDAVAGLVARLMSKKPEDRPATAGDVAAALEPHARYAPDAVPSRPRAAAPRGDTAPAGSTVLPSGPDSSVRHRPLLAVPPEPAPVPQPVAPSDNTPRPHDFEDALPPADAGGDRPPSKRLAAARWGAPPPAARTRRAVWWIVGAVAGVALLALAVWAAILPSTKQPAPAAPKPAPDGGTRPAPVPPRAAGIVPAVNFARLHALAALVPDGTGVVVVAYPSAYFRDKESPFVRGSGPGKLSQFASRFQTDTELNMPLSDRVVFSLQAGKPRHYAIASEGPYLSAKFAADLDANKRLTPRPPTKGLRSFKVYAAGGDRATALFQPPEKYPNPAPIYFAFNGKEIPDKAAPRLLPAASRTSPDLEAGVLPALNAALDSPPPLLLAVASGRQTLPFADEPTVKELGAELVVVAVRITDRMEVDVTVHADSHAGARRFVDAFAGRVREEYPFSGRLLSAALLRALTDAPADTGNQLTLKVRWTPEQWSAFLDQLLG